MGISDELMWRYWELLTDRSLTEISAMKAEEPMQVKMRLARQIVGDFHSAEDATQAQADFDREVRGGQEPDDIETVHFPPEAGSSLPKILLGTNMVQSRTDAERLIRAGAVEVDGVKYTDFSLKPANVVVIRVGKKWKRLEP